MDDSTTTPTMRSKLVNTGPGQWLKRLVNAARARKWARKNTGPGSFVDESCHFIGRRNVQIGSNVVVSEDVCFNVNHRTENDAVVIGDNSYIGRRAFFSSAKKIELGPYALVGADCRFIGAGHVMDDPFKPYVATGTTSEASIVVGANCWLGVDVMLLGDTRIGHGSIVGAGATVIGATIPPFSLVVGAPARVIKRYSISAGAWVVVSAFTAEEEAALPDEATYLAQLIKAHPRPNLPAIAAARSQGHLP